jgi:hypothetical protein
MPVDLLGKPVALLGGDATLALPDHFVEGVIAAVLAWAVGSIPRAIALHEEHAQALRLGMVAEQFR